MSRPITISDELLRDAQSTAAASESTAAAQIEFWARLGRAIEPLLHSEQTSTPNGEKRSLAECLASVDTDAGRKRLAAYLQSLPFPHYEQAPDAPHLLIRIDEDGRRTRGRFVNGEFKAEA